MKLIERNPLPLICQECIAKQKETGEYDDCYNCDYALDRWEMICEDKDTGDCYVYRP